MSKFFKLTLPNNFNLRQTLNCGQCFRFTEPEQDKFCGVFNGKYIELTLNLNTVDVFCETDTSPSELSEFFDLDFDYDTLNSQLCSDETLKKAIEYAGGIRILKQPPWETLCSFILSQNNNIKRISGIIERLCETFGDPIGNNAYSFPDAEKLANLTLSDLDPLRSGFRAKYVLDAAQKVCSKEVDLDEVAKADTDTAREMLMKIKGVGPKVADCTLLFGFHKLDAFPQDVWIKKVMAKYYPDGLPEYAKKYGGIAQQYLFHYIRTAENLNND